MTTATLDYYRTSGRLSDPAGHAAALAALPRGVAGVARVVQGLLLHEHWSPAYGVTLSDERRAESQLRSVPQILDRALALDARPLDVARSLDGHVVGVCRHFSLLGAAILRAQGVPARARCGFGAYFMKGTFEDHWVCEYWNAEQSRWVLADTQLDPLQQKALRPDFDVLDVPRDRFVIAGDAWTQCRAGAADPVKFGIFDMRGLWFVAGNVLRDAAALNHMEMLPWDVWGGMLSPGEEPKPDALAWHDRLAALTLAPDARHDELRALYETDARLRVPGAIHNAIRNRMETL